MKGLLALVVMLALVVFAALRVVAWLRTVQTGVPVGYGGREP